MPPCVLQSFQKFDKQTKVSFAPKIKLIDMVKKKRPHKGFKKTSAVRSQQPAAAAKIT